MHIIIQISTYINYHVTYTRIKSLYDLLRAGTKKSDSLTEAEIVAIIWPNYGLWRTRTDLIVSLYNFFIRIIQNYSHYPNILGTKKFTSPFSQFYNDCMNVGYNGYNSLLLHIVG